MGTAVTETASLVGGYPPTGSVTFRLFSDEACTAEVFSSTNVVTVNGSATSNPFVPTAPGTYRWTASYSGDANNNSFTTQCDPSNSVTITGIGMSTTTTSTTTVPTSTTTTSTLPPSTTTTGPTSTTSSSTTSTSSTTSSTTTSTSIPPTGTTSSSTTSSTTSSTSSSTTSSTTPGSSTTSTVIQSTTSSTTPPATTSTSTSSTTTSTSTSSTTTTTTVATTTTSTTPTSTSTTAAGSSSTTTSTVAPVGPGQEVAPFVQVSPQQAAPGDAVTVTGGGFPPITTLQAELFSDPVLLGTTITDAGGAFSLVVTIPLDSSPGLHTLRVGVVGGTLQAETTLTVTGPVRLAHTTPAAILSRTGAEVTGPARLAMTMVGLGALLVGLAWRDGRYVPALARRSGWPARTRWPRRGHAWPARRSWTARRSLWRR